MNTFKKGQKVFVKPGVIDPDFLVPLGNLVGIVHELDQTYEDYVLIAYTNETLAQMPEWYQNSCNDIGVSPDLCSYHYKELGLIDE